MTVRPDVGVSLKIAGAFDLGRMARIHKACFSDSWGRADLARLLALPGGFGVLARVREGGFPGLGQLRSAGFTLCRVVRDECEMLSIGVLPRYRQLGIAKVLLFDAMSRCQAAGAQWMFLEVAFDNEHARQLYHHAGFEIVGQRSNYYARPDGSRVHAYTMRRQLNADLQTPQEDWQTSVIQDKSSI